MMWFLGPSDDDVLSILSILSDDLGMMLIISLSDHLHHVDDAAAASCSRPCSPVVAVVWWCPGLVLPGGLPTASTGPYVCCHSTVFGECALRAQFEPKMR